jgi:hypothetical protein
MGGRSAQAGQQLLAAGFAEVYNLREGMQAWKAAGYAIERSEQNERKPLSLPRQVQIVAGLLGLIGTILGVVGSPWFLLLSGLVGAELLYAGITNTCVMAMWLARLPYNRRA